MRIELELSAVSVQQSAMLWAGMLLVALGLAGRCRAAGELPASCRIRVVTGQVCTPQGCTGQEENLGSGTLVDVRDGAGLVLTCAHVIEGAQEILIEFPNGRTHGATVVASDRAADVALLEIAKPTVAPIPLAASFAPGDELIVAGYGGEGIWQASRGSTRLQDNGARVNLVVATAVRSGDSGGPAVNARGELVGVVWGCNGETYVTSGAPLQTMLMQFCEPRQLFPGRRQGGLIQGAAPLGVAPGQQQPAAAACECKPELAAIGKRLDGIDAQLSSFAKRDELAKYLPRSETPMAPDLSRVATRDDVAQIAKASDAADKSLLERIHDVAGVAKEAAASAAAGQVGLAQGLSVGKMLAVALGVSGPIGLGIMVAGGLAGRRLKKRLAGAGGRSATGDFPDY